MLTRPFISSDATYLVPLWDANATSRQFTRHLHQLARTNGRSWVIANPANQPIGYATVSTVPGLPQMMALDGGILPDWRRQGAGRQLLTTLIAAMERQTAVSQLSAAVRSDQPDVARFLQVNGFGVEHVEWQMRRSLASQPSTNRQPQPPTDQLTVQLADDKTAVSTFLTLYDQSFAHTPWHQPFTAEEVRLIRRPTDQLYLLSQHARPIGFAWVHFPRPNQALIEPIGIIRHRQHQGHGRFLLHTLLNQLYQQGVKTVELGVWASNQTAVSLYHTLGFQKIDSTTYYAYQLHPPAA